MLRPGTLLAVAAAAAGGGATTVGVAGVGSCNHHYDDQAYWGVVGGALRGLRGGQPADAFIWLGDIVYGDDYVFPAKWVPTGLGEVVKRYAVLRGNPHYAAFAGGAVGAVLGVWDDHDIGRNNAQGDVPDKDTVQGALMDFLDVPEASPRRRQQGAYSFTALPFRGDAAEGWWAEEYEHALCVVLLDVRYYQNLTAGDLLGEAQWAWLEALAAAELSDAAQRRATGKKACMATAVGGGIQVVPDVFVDFEAWARFPASRARLFRTLRDARVERVVLLSGDVHFGEITRDARPEAAAHLGYPVHELTASGLTHACGEWGHKRGDPEVECWFEAYFRSAARAAATFGRNFGSVEVRAHDNRTSEVVLRMHDVYTGAAVGALSIPLSGISYPDAPLPAPYAGTPYPPQPTPPTLAFMRDIAHPAVASVLPGVTLGNLLFGIMYGTVVASGLAAVGAGAAVLWVSARCVAG